MKTLRLLLPLLLLLAACAPPPPPAVEPTLAATASAPAPTATPTNLPISQSTHSPTPADALSAQTADTPTPAPTDTPIPNTQFTNTPTPAPTPAPIAPIAVVFQNANLRGGPGTGYPVVGNIGGGQNVFLRSRNPAGDWIRLDMTGEGQVWIAAFLLDLPAGIDLPVAEDIPAPPTPSAADAVVMRETTLNIPTYPWQRFTAPALDEITGWEYQRFDGAAYAAANPRPQSQTYRLLVLENRWLKLTLLPDLGGRVYQMFFKPTGSNELYQNPVIKPSPWGPQQQGHGWLAAGGIEWGLPVVEHGYAWGEIWGHITQPRPPLASIILFDRGQDRLHLDVEVGLEPDSAAFTLDFRLENMGETAVQANYWTNAMLAPGPANRVGPDLRFIVPGDQARVHSSGESDLPGEAGVFDWPVYNGRSIDRLGSWQHWLGFFAYPQAQADWVAVYDSASDEGVVRIFPRQIVPGLKGFGFGFSDPIAPDLYTDDGSSYVELHGGLTPTFAESLTFGPGEQRGWRETWYPVSGIGGVTQADAGGAAHLIRQDDGLHLRLFSVTTRSGEISVADSAGELLHFPVSLDPATPLDLPLPLSDGPISFRFQPSSGPAWTMSGL